MSYLVVGVAYIHKEPPPVVGRTHIYELLQLETVCILERYSNTLTFSAYSNELVTYLLEYSSMCSVIKFYIAVVIPY